MSPGTKAGSRLRTAMRWVPVLLVLGACAYLARTVDLHALTATLLDVRGAPLALAVLFAALGGVVRAAYWYLLVNTSATVPFRTMATYTFASYATNVIPPRAGEALRVWLLQQRHGVPLTTSAAILAIEKVADVASLLLLISPLPWLIPDLPPSVGHALRVLPCIVVLAAVAMAVASRHTARFRFLEGFRVIHRPGVVAAALACVLVAWLVDVGAILSVLGSVRIPLSLEKALLVILSVNVAVSVPITPGQLGAHELGSAMGLRMAGVPEVHAIPFALLYHATQLLTTLGIGLVTAFALSSAAREFAASRAAPGGDAPPGVT